MKFVIVKLYFNGKADRAMGRKKDKNQNYLDYVFMKNPAYKWKEKEDGKVCLIIEWKGFYHWIAQKVFHKPKQSEIAMDALGSFVWKQLDGERDMHEVAELVKAEFGAKAEPVYERLIKFVEIMKDNKFVLLKEEKTMLSYIIYILLFAVLGAVLYAWGLKKAQNQSVELAKMLYAKCAKVVKKELKRKNIFGKMR